jgi:hypothetical protein
MLPSTENVENLSSQHNAYISFVQIGFNKKKKKKVLAA